MKTPFIPAFGALCFMSSLALAQPRMTERELTERQVQEEYFSPAAPAGVTLRVLKSGTGEPSFYLAASKSNAAQILQHIAIVTGERLIAAPALQNGETKTFSAARFSLAGLIEAVASSYQLQSTEIAPGVRLFAPMPIESAGEWAYKDRLASKVRDEQLSDYNRTIQREKNQEAIRQMRAEQEALRADPRYDPFVFPYGGLNPNLKGWGVSPKPQPHWEKREFNGHEFYHIPIPKDAPSKS